jgi:hypothetical protein
VFLSRGNRARLAVILGAAWRIYWGPAPLPVGAEALGTVTRGNGEDGALLRLPTGAYAQGNAGVLCALDKRKVQAAIAAATPRSGGAQPGSGRPTADGVRGMRRVNVMLDDASAEKLRTLGDGELSLGIRRAAARIE